MTEDQKIEMLNKCRQKMMEAELRKACAEGEIKACEEVINLLEHTPVTIPEKKVIE